ncbi:MAG: UvrB/UvrC motif-containing protein [Spirochaetales bacterium]|nr:UvrB/UvrC motif-containing protein [Spirochaetales bacterium]
MLCDICGNEEAIIHIQQIMGNEVMELHLCSACAKEKGISTDDNRVELSLSSLLTGLVDVDEEGETDSAVCPSCGKTIEQFRDDGLLGCPDCFEAFQTDIASMLKNMTGFTQHRGKYPRKLATYKTILFDREQLKKQLKEAVEREAYEEAAGIRDRIRALERSVEEKDD